MEPHRKHSVVGAILHTCYPCGRTIPYRIYAVFHTCGIIALMYHHVHSLLTANNTLITCLLLLSDMVLTFIWVTTTSLRLNPVHRTEYPEKYAAKPEDFPKLDVFICTADPYKEPPMMVVNTALSVMAYEYPSDKISVYVSDDGGSSLTLFALMEAAKFSEHWLPFCKKNNVQDRSPAVYFSSKSDSRSGEAENIKMMYEDMKSRVEHVVKSGKVETAFITYDQFRGVFDLWTDKFTRHDHPTIIQVLQNSETDMDTTKKYIMPNLIYVSREKSKVSPHHFKAGALNTLLRVSGVMTNSPIILTLDCDMYSNDPTTPVRALCYLTDPEIKSGLGYVQFPQKFLEIGKNDIYACENKRLFNINMVGFDGLMGPTHVGTGCFFNRRAFYGPPSKLILPEIDELRPYRIADKSIKAQDVLALTHNVAGCIYEYNTNWGSNIGFRYGSLVEDYYTGYMFHCEGWRSIFCNPKKAAFYGDSSKCLVDVVGQQIRWAVGLLEILFSKKSPIFYGFKSLGLLMGLGYCNSPFRPFWSIPVTVYGLLPQLALIYGVSVFPKASDPWFCLYIFLFFGAYAQDLLDFLLEGGTCRKWWNDQRMLMIKGLSSFFFGFIEFILKTLNLSTPKFNITSKANDDDEQRKRYEQEIFDFGTSSSMFLPLTTVAIVNLLAFVCGLYGILFCGGELVLELMLVSFAVVNCLPIYEAMVLRKDDGNLPKRISFLAGNLTVVLIVSSYFVLK
ncbi:cellulose synthase-like protein G1 isoform X4 [Arabidopsis lyrata subsp. lyrata]|uniref:cellulose synthase-like protein G1 isoform X4 n=1 Tax=Arabidopsis lyrata subsp. lyrata TaxID=81972 RepID=UPI000A29DBF6|nr:cellulose synthase-like protein G1 isoform X4 [Arabidopsis lyrata subsp. lyrata]|eukprot:XP_020873283.1 cellulose synthase-like protein G1 isoform X4 [Arabidopsis lyrata subsp. lyrata]